MRSALERRSPLSRAALAAAVLLSLVVLFLPASGVPTAPPGVDTVVHVVVFLALAVTGRWAGAGRNPLLAALAAYAVVSELIQGVSPLGRSGSAADVLADLAGILLGLTIWQYAERRTPVP